MKKLLSVLLVAVLLLSTAVTGVYMPEESDLAVTAHASSSGQAKLATDWSVENGNIAVKVYLKDVQGLESLNLILKYDKNLFNSIEENKTIGEDAMMYMLSSSLMLVFNHNNDGEITFGAAFMNKYNSTEDFEIATFYLTVENSDAFYTSITNISLEGEMNFDDIKINVSDSIKKDEACYHSKWNIISVKDATCISTGTKIKECAYCGQITTETLPIDTNNHTNKNESVIEPTCTQTGLRTITCTGCQTNITETLASLGHDEIQHPGKEATCHESGWNNYVTCTRCDYTTYEAIEALGHEAGDVIVIHNGMPVYECKRDEMHYFSLKTSGASGDVDGNGTITSNDARSTLRFAVNLDSPTPLQFTAADINKNGIISSEDARSILRAAVGLEQIESTGGTTEIFEYDVKKTNPSCSTAGEIIITCKTCKNTVTTIEVSAGTGHSYTSRITKQPTCSATGVKTYTCSSCGTSYTETIAKTVHSYTEQRTEPTCNKQGSVKTVCSVCGNVSSTQTLPATGKHSYTSKVTKQPTCSATGVRTYTCSSCGTSYTETIAKTGHSYTSRITKQPTCSATGVRTYTCSSCGTSYTETIAKSGHYYSYYSCDYCGQIQDGKYFEFMKNIIKVNGYQISNDHWGLMLNNFNSSYDFVIGLSPEDILYICTIVYGEDFKLEFMMYLPCDDPSVSIEGLMSDVDNYTGETRTQCYFVCQPSGVRYDSIVFYDGVYDGYSSVKETFLNLTRSMIQLSLVCLGRNLIENGYVFDYDGFGFPYFEAQFN